MAFIYPYFINPYDESLLDGGQKKKWTQKRNIRLR